MGDGGSVPVGRVVGDGGSVPWVTVGLWRGTSSILRLSYFFLPLEKSSV